MITKDSIETTKGFKRTSPRLLSYWKICFNGSWRQLCQQGIIYQRDDVFSNSTLERKKKNPAVAELFAEREGFEPPVPLGTVVFKTTVIDHSTISPVL